MSAIRSHYSKVIFALVLISSCTAHAQTEAVLYKFNGSSIGVNSSPDLIAGGDGRLYGITQVGGAGYGTAYELSANGDGGWKETTLHTFTINSGDGYIPQALAIDGKGNLFGTTYLGGANERGVLYELSPAAGEWTETILFSFGEGSAGADPFGNLIIDAEGDIFGTEDINTTGNVEAVYQASPSNGYAPNVIYNTNFITATGGLGGLAMDASGNIFGISVQAYSPQIAIAFELSPNRNGGWNSKVLYTFSTGIEPESPPTLDKTGRIYGTTTRGGARNNGSVYRLARGPKGQWTARTLYSFKGGKADGSGPYSAVVFDASGNMYGTTIAGGKFNKGTVFELSAAGNGSYWETILWSFAGADGDGPVSRLVRDSAGHLHGTTSMGGDTGCGGAKGCGLVFEVTP